MHVKLGGGQHVLAGISLEFLEGSQRPLEERRILLGPPCMATSGKHVQQSSRHVLYLTGFLRVCC